MIAVVTATLGAAGTIIAVAVGTLIIILIAEFDDLNGRNP